MDPNEPTFHLCDLLHKQIQKTKDSRCPYCSGANPKCTYQGQNEETIVDPAIILKIDLRDALKDILGKDEPPKEELVFCYEELWEQRIADIKETYYNHRLNGKYLCANLPEFRNHLQKVLAEFLAKVRREMSATDSLIIYPSTLWQVPQSL